MDFIQCCLSNKDKVATLNIIDYTLSIYPNNPYAMYFKGVVYMHTNRLPEAIALFQYIVQKINPRYSQAYYNLGYCYLNCKDYDKALACFKNCISIERKNKEAYEYIIKILIFQNKTEEANKIIEMAKKL
jgi:tetratricopeptide (TPR) repeat protein